MFLVLLFLKPSRCNQFRLLLFFFVVLQNSRLSSALPKSNAKTFSPKPSHKLQPVRGRLLIFHFSENHFAVDSNLCLTKSWKSTTSAARPVLLLWVSHDVTAAMLVSPNKETAAMLVSRPNPPGIERHYYGHVVFCFR